MKNKWFILIILLLIGSSIYGFIEYNRANKDVAKQRAAYSLTSSELFDEYSANENAADEKYRTQIIEVSGKVEEVITHKDKQTIVLTASEYPIGGVSCTMNESDETIQVGDVIQVKGECQGFLMQVILNRAIISQK